MRRARDESGARLFRIEEFLMPQQIAAFFSRLAVQSRQQVDEGEIHEEDISATVEESNFDDVRKNVNQNVNLQHPIIVDQYDVCQLVHKTFSYTEGEDSGNWRVVMDKMEKCCIGEVNAEIYERYCFNKRDKLPTESVDCFVAELKTLAKTCNFCDCLRDSLIRDRIVLGIKDKQTTKKLLRIRDLTLNRCIDICRSEEVTALHMKSLSEPVDNINQVKCN